MHITITKNDSVKDLKDQFTQLFPNLKIECFYHSHDDGEGSAKGDMIDENTQLTEIRKNNMNGSFEFDKAMTIADFEDFMRDDFGLNVQVFRKSGDVWIETTITDSWTLEKQEETANEMNN